MFNYKLWRGLTAALIFVFAAVVAFTSLAFTRSGDVNRVLGTTPPAAEVTDDTNYYPSEYDGKEEMRAALVSHFAEVQEEGSVLLKNDANALPLASGASVTLFGSGAADPIYNGGGRSFGR